MNRELVIIAGLFGGDRGIIPYRAKIAKILGVTGAILLQQIVYWWQISEHKPFYKFKQKCKHKLYRDGDSWCEELAFTRREFDAAIARIGARKTAKMTMAQALKERKPVIYWTDRGRVTHYTVNPIALIKVLEQAYPLKAESCFSKSTDTPLGKGVNELYLKAESCFTSTEITRDQPETNTEIPVSLFPELSLPPQTHTEDLRDRMGGATDPLDLAMVLEGKNGPRNSGRPCGWEDHSDAVFEVCRRIADLWRKGSLPTGTWGDEVEKWAAYASEFLAMHDGDLSKTLETITRYHEHYGRENLTFTISGPKSLRNVLPAFLASGSKPKQKRGKRPVGIWTQGELDVARMEALATPPLEILYGGDFLNMGRAEQAEGLKTARPRLLEWARASTGDERHAIYEAGGPEVLVERILKKEMGKDT